jgi:hypothetical protein
VRRATLPFALAVALPALATTRFASAYDADVDATIAAQAYQLKGISGDPVLSRRRITSTLALGVYNLVDTGEAGPRVFFRARMRIDGDFGVSSEEYNLKSPDYARFIPGLQPAPVDLMYGYVEGKRFARGYVGFKLGRQYVIDPLGFYAFDGLLLNLTTPAYFRVEAYAGFEVRGGLPLSSARWDGSGIQRGDRTDIDRSRLPSLQPAKPAPMYAVAIETAGPTWVHGRLTYRKAWNTGPTFVGGGGALLGPDQIGVYDQKRVSSERLGYGASVQLSDVASLQGNLVYDLYGRRWNSIEASGDVFVGKRVTAGLAYSYWHPIFDADSIWNVFGIEPMDDASVRLEVDPTERLSLSADAMVRRYLSDDSAQAGATDNTTTGLPRVTYDTASSYAPGGGLRGRYKWATATMVLRGSVLDGDQGRRVGADLSLDKVIDGRYLLDGRLSLWNFQDKLRSDGDRNSRTATSIGYVLGAGYKLSPEATTQLQFEHDVNRLVGMRYRLFAVLNVRVWL